MAKKILAGDFQGGHGRGTSPGRTHTGYRGQGTLKYKTTGSAHTSKDLIAGSGERLPMPNPRHGRVLYSSKNKRIGRQEGTGPQS